jgi:hypothetical protein
MWMDAITALTAAHGAILGSEFSLLVKLTKFFWPQPSESGLEKICKYNFLFCHNGIGKTGLCSRDSPMQQSRTDDPTEKSDLQMTFAYDPIYISVEWRKWVILQSRPLMDELYLGGWGRAQNLRVYTMFTWLAKQMQAKKNFSSFYHLNMLLQFDKQP